MVQSIVAVDSKTGSGLITFFINVDGQGCNEDFSVTIDGQTFTNHISHGAEDNPAGSIQTTKGGVGDRSIVVTAVTSNVSSTARLINL